MVQFRDVRRTVELATYNEHFLVEHFVGRDREASATPIRQWVA